MGIYYSAHIVVGYRFIKNELLSPFEKHTTEFYHMEKRFDQKTGEELPEVKVIDKESLTTYYLNNVNFDYHDEFIEKLCTLIDCEYCTLGDLNGLESSIILSPNYDFQPYFLGDDFGKVEFGNSYKLSDIINLKEKLDVLKNKLQSLRLRVPEPGVFLAYSYG